MCTDREGAPPATAFLGFVLDPVIPIIVTTVVLQDMQKQRSTCASSGLLWAGRRASSSTPIT